MYKEERDDWFIYGKENFFIKFGISNNLICLRMLNRLEPYTSSFLMTNSKIDDPNRTFHNVAKQWDNLNNDKQVNDELIPELFYFPEILRNQ